MGSLRVPICSVNRSPATSGRLSQMLQATSHLPLCTGAGRDHTWGIQHPGQRSTCVPSPQGPERLATASLRCHKSGRTSRRAHGHRAVTRTLIVGIKANAMALDPLEHRIPTLSDAGLSFLPQERSPCWKVSVLHGAIVVGDRNVVWRTELGTDTQQAVFGPS